MSFTQYPRAATGASIGSTVTGATQGSVLFAGAAGVLAQNNAAFNWDDANNQLTITAQSATDIPTIIKGAASQTANLQEWRDSASVVKASVGSGGVVTANQFIGTNGGVEIVRVYSGYFMGVGSGTFYFRSGGAYQFTDSGGIDIFRMDKPGTAGQTGLQLWDADNATLERVTVGAADSGGSGYKVLRIPN